MKLITFLIVCSLTFVCCVEPELRFEKKKVGGESSVYFIMKGDSLVADIGFYPDGGLEYIVNFPKSVEQSIYYHRDGMIESKLNYNDSSNVDVRISFIKEVGICPVTTILTME